MAIFTAIATTVLAGTFLAGTIATPILAGALALGASYAAQAIIGSQNKPAAAAADRFTVQGQLQTSGVVPRSFQLGYSVTPGSLAYANEWGNDGETPNAFHTQVITLQDLPGGSIVELWVSGVLCHIDYTASPTPQGYPVAEYRKDGKDHLWIKFYDGHQTTADPFLVGTVSSAERPYQATRVGVGKCYVIATALLNETLFGGQFPTYKFAMSGIPLYDISRDSSMGGNGPQRWADRTTWGGDGDGFPAVQAYNILRGITFNGQWVYGLQNMAAARLPASNWIMQIEKCREPIEGEDGPEPSYRSGGQINVNTQPINAIEALMLSCQGRICEIGGFYKIYLGAPDSPSFFFTDDDVLVEEKTFKPFATLAESVNGVAASYPLPAEGWADKVAPALLRPDFEARDGNRRLLANPSFTMVPHSAQVQRLMSSALEEARRERSHILGMPPKFWTVEPGDIGAWISEVNGYDGKLFRTDGAVDRANCDVNLALKEIDPTDYDWDHDADFDPLVVVPTVLDRVKPQGVRDWNIYAGSMRDASGVSRRPTLEFEWDGTLPGVIGVEFEIRLNSDHSRVTEGASPPGTYARGAMTITQSLLPLTVYQFRYRFVPSSPRDMLWSEWRNVTTLDVRLTQADLLEGIRDVLDNLEKTFDISTKDVEKRLSDQLTIVAARVRESKNVLNDQSWDHRVDLINRIEVGDALNGASIDEVRTVAISTSTAFASYQLTVNARLGAIDSTVATNALAISTLTSSFSAYQVTVTAKFGAVESSVTSLSASLSTLNSAFSSNQLTVSARLGSVESTTTATAISLASLNESVSAYQVSTNSVLGGHTTSINQSLYSINQINGTLASKYGVTLTTDGYVTGFQTVNGGAGFSSFTVLADTFQVQKPGINGDAPVPLFTVGTFNGQPAMGFRGNFYLTGTIYGDSIVAYSLDVNRIKTQSIDSDSGVIRNLGVRSLSIGDNAVTVAQALTLADQVDAIGSNRNIGSLTFNVDTTGLAGKPIAIKVDANVQVGYPGTTTTPIRILATVNGGIISTIESNIIIPFIALSGLYTSTMTGGVMSFQVDLFFYGEVGGGSGTLPLSFVNFRTLSAVTVKR